MATQQELDDENKTLQRQEDATRRSLQHFPAHLECEILTLSWLTRIRKRCSKNNRTSKTEVVVLRDMWICVEEGEQERREKAGVGAHSVGRRRRLWCQERRRKCFSGWKHRCKN